jgi:hypothetical protein
VTKYTVAIGASRIRWWLDLKSPTALRATSDKTLVAPDNRPSCTLGTIDRRLVSGITRILFLYY